MLLCVLSIVVYFQPANSLPTARETQLGDVVTQTAKQPRKCKAYTVFTTEQRAAIGRYASENGNVAAVSQ